MKLRIDKAVYGGYGLAHDVDGRAIFVPFTLPGELVEAVPFEGSGSNTKAELIRVDEGSQGRVEARCKHFGQCGGCHYQHAHYDLQIAMKADILCETLKRAGLRALPRVRTHASEGWGYRSRIRLRVEVAEGAIQFGYNLRETREFLAIQECPISAPYLWGAVQALRKLFLCNELCALWMRSVEEIELFGDGTWLQISLLLRDATTRLPAGFDSFCELLSVAIPELRGVGVGGGGEEMGGWGKTGSIYVVQNKGYWVTRGGFFQVNRWLVEDLVRLVTMGRKGLIAWDLYAGVGLFSRVLADTFSQVLAVEANPLAMRDLAAAKVENIRGLPVSVVSFLRRAVFERERPDLVVMDPPRMGAGKEVCSLLTRLQVPQIVYVSCDPATLSRDLRGMVDSGYNLAELHLVDLFPQTFHMETVAVLQR